MFLAILGGIIFEIDSWFEYSLSNILVQYDIEFGELSDNLLRFLRLFNKPFPLSLQIFHNNFNLYFTIIISLLHFVKTYLQLSLRYIKKAKITTSSWNHVKMDTIPFNVALLPFWILFNLDIGDYPSNLLLGLCYFSTVSSAKLKYCRAVFSFYYDFTLFDCPLSFLGVTILNFL